MQVGKMLFNEILSVTPKVMKYHHPKRIHIWQHRKATSIDDYLQKYRTSYGWWGGAIQMSTKCRHFVLL